MRINSIFTAVVLCLAAAFCFGTGDITSASDIDGLGYVEAWRKFYPSQAYDAGMTASIFGFEDYSGEAIGNWIALNRAVLETPAETEAAAPLEERIDMRLLRSQARSEILRWEEQAPHRTSPGLYAAAIAGTVNRVLDSPVLMPGKKFRLVRSRLSGIRRMAAAARAQLVDCAPDEGRRATESLEKSGMDCDALPERLAGIIPAAAAADFAADCRAASADLRSLAGWIRTELLSKASLIESPILGYEHYARRLRMYTDSDLTPERLEELALEEIETVRHLMDELSAEYLKKAYPDRPLPSAFDARVGRALADMEEDRPRTEAEYLARLRVFAADIERFVREKGLAGLPEQQTLSVELAPESAGPMARIGYVRSAPAFHPNPWTTWYLATIPDSHPAAEREDFWRSFNYHFKRFVVIHELFPGHYLQEKIVRENPHPVRILFPYGPYEEGWATLCERIVLEAGWADDDPLTRLAQLRKRLENANRAYTSVQAHCRGWDEERILKFSVVTSLLAPQFAKSLWGRLMSEPFQMTTYFLGTRMFTEVYERERNRLGDRFRIRRFMDTVLRAGPIPIDAFPEIFLSFQD